MAQRFGAFGKMPALGDFLRMDLPQGFVDPWDRWLQQGLMGVAAAMGEAWQEAYFSAPIWRFHLSPGLVGAASVMGVMTPSVDRVGRQFPMTLASPLPDGNAPILDHFMAAGHFAALEEIALAALEDDMTRDDLQVRLAALPPIPPSVALTVTRQKGGLVAVGGTPGALGRELASALIAGDFRKPSIWSAEVGGTLRMMICEGLPAGGQMRGIYDMQARIWQQSEAE